MRLLKLRFKNINSLAGEYEIDFADPVYEESGIFAIVGPTGSGKTSILDAICLALYGETPRTVEAKQKGDREEACIVLTKNRTECYAQAVFEAHGRVWLSRWSRAMGPRSKRLGEARVELALLEDAGDGAGRIIADKKTEWSQCVAWLLGMDFTGFTRCVLLAQGAFANLLRAKIDDRAAILERITGTEIYSEIGKTVYERKDAEEARLEMLEGQARSEAPLSDEERSALEKSLEAAAAAEAAAQQERRRTSEALEKRRGFDAAHNAEKAAALEVAAARKACEEAESERIRAAAARRALGAAEALSQKRDAVSRLERNEAALARCTTKAKACAEALDVAQSALTASFEAESAAQKAQAAFEPDYAAITQADAAIAECGRNRASAEDSLQKAEAAKRSAEVDSSEKRAAALKVEAALQSALARLEASAADEPLVQALAGIRAAVNAHKSARLADKDSKTRLESASERLAKAQRTGDGARANMAGATMRHREALAALGLRKEARERAMAGSSLEEGLIVMRQSTGEWWGARWAAALEAEIREADKALALPALPEAVRAYPAGVRARARAQLDDIVERFPALAAGIAPERLQMLEAAVEKLRSWSKTAGDALAAYEAAAADEAKARKALDEARSAASAAEAEILKAQAERDAAAAQQARDFDALERAREAYLAGTRPFFEESELLSAKPAQVLKKLEARLEARETAKAEAARLRIEKETALGAQAAAERVLQERLRSFSEAKTLAMQLSESLAELTERRRSRWGETDPEKARRRYALQTKQAHADVLARQKTCDECRSAAAAAAAEEKTLLAQRQECQSAERAAALSLDAALERAGFADEAALEAAMLDETSLLKLEARLADLDQRASRAAGALAEAKRRAGAARELLESDEEAAAFEARELEARLQTRERTASEAGAARGRIAAQLEADNAKRARSQALRREIEAARQTFQEWSKLNALIGSKSGHYFRQAAQKLTFRLLLANANEVLGQMDSRYRLAPSGETGLDVAVRDEELAGLVRTSFNLSGGETFLVSLALALALARISSKKLRVDTLFLDEGFGSLDAETLEKALGALENLQARSKKLIGLISHVRAVRERIDVHIVVRPKGGAGESEIAGPGVRRL